MVSFIFKKNVVIYTFGEKNYLQATIISNKFSNDILLYKDKFNYYDLLIFQNHEEKKR